MSFEYLLGAICGDGSLYIYHMNKSKWGTGVKYVVELAVTDKEFAEEVYRCLKVFTKNSVQFFVRRRKQPHNSLYSTYVNDKELYNCLKEMIEHLGECISSWKYHQKCMFLRGLFDSEGSFVETKYPDRTCRQLSFTNKDERLIHIVKQLLHDLGIKSHFYLTKDPKRKFHWWRIMIYRKSDLHIFSDLVGFTIKRKRVALKNSLLGV